VKAIHIYVEGGGPTKRTQSKLREGFDSFCRTLKTKAASRNISLRFIMAGSRNEAFDDFQTACLSNPDRINLLLVDSEYAVALSPKAHLIQFDQWELSTVEENSLHLMVQCMEAWLVADPEVFAEYYGSGLNANGLPRRQNLEEEAKIDILSALKSATAKSKKGTYDKVEHASALLARVDPTKSQSRCPYCQRFFKHVSELCAKLADV
jgi:hypothetical protein